MPAQHFDNGKPPLAYLPAEALTEVAKVLEYGTQKYELHNWRHGMPWLKLANSTLRHLFSWLSGEDKDPESGLSHLAHAACNILFLLTYAAHGSGTDDRYKGK